MEYWGLFTENVTGMRTKNKMTNQTESINKLITNLGLERGLTENLATAFTHRSYLNENRSRNLVSNERLEFLGDAVLELVATEYLYENYDKPEGQLTALRSALVRGKSISDSAKDLQLFECLSLSAGEKKGSQRAKDLILANTFEALVGAIYLDYGLEKSSFVINKYVLNKIDKIINEKLYIDSKSEFQEKVQEYKKTTPSYRLLDEAGPDHDKKFTCGVYIGEELVATGEGPSKNTAEQDAAEAAIKILFS
jgi:ribonuclease-3